ncbi:MAG: selenocysteine synthase [Candidatus Campylobacter infans]|nr:MAG: selenocysteine synthase [Candidatus Campylobacter infans]
MADFSSLPQIDKIINLQCFKNAPKPVITRIARDIINEQRELLIQEKSALNKEQIIAKITSEYENFKRKSLQRVINASGIVLHTNLGRSVIDENIYERAKSVICGYSNLEYDLQTGARSNRYDYSGALLSALFGCEDALIVNNNAAAVFLVLNTFAKNAQVIVSRGELVEIGGGFRIPEVMNASGAILNEIGTTNKTRLSDYENAINENTKMLLKVHHSNFQIQGFSSEVSINELANLGKKHEILSYYDLGSCAFSSLNWGLERIQASATKLLFSGVDLLSFSGDKLFGSVQAGIILANKNLIARLRSNQLLRMLRADKITLSLLCQSVMAYLKNENHLITTQKLINKSLNELESLANALISGLNENAKKRVKIIKTSTFVGGGSLPNKQIPSIALQLSGKAKSLQAQFRAKNIIGRIENECFLLDLRALLDDDINALNLALNEILA